MHTDQYRSTHLQHIPKATLAQRAHNMELLGQPGLAVPLDGCPVLNQVLIIVTANLVVMVPWAQTTKESMIRARAAAMLCCTFHTELSF